MKRLSLLLVALLSSGCLHSQGPKFYFPSDIASNCHHARNQSKIHIKDCGTNLGKGTNLTVVKIKGEKKIQGKWAWRHAASRNGWVYGLCNGSRIKVGCNPTTGGEVSYDVLHHECGHYWLIPLGQRGHPVQYDKYFKWSWADRATGRGILCLHGEGLDGKPYVIDFVREPHALIQMDGIKLKNAPWGDIKAILESGEEWVEPEKETTE